MKNSKKVSDFGDVLIFESADYYEINFCGVCSLYKKLF